MACRQYPTHSELKYRFAGVFGQIILSRATIGLKTVALPFPAGRSKASHKGMEDNIANLSTAGARCIAELLDHSYRRLPVAVQLNRYQGHKGRGLIRPSNSWAIDFTYQCFPWAKTLYSSDFPLHSSIQYSDQSQKEPSTKYCQ